MKNTKTKKTGKSADLPESFDDKKHLEPDEGILDLPDVSDIPGQEHIKVPPLGELADTTISSDDEEGVGIFDDEDEDILFDNSASLSKEEKKILRDASEKMPSQDEVNLEHAQLDQVDEDGELLNEKSDLSGSDLDIPGSEQDDANEEIGAEDEENNFYSQDGDREDNNNSQQD